MTIHSGDYDSNYDGQDESEMAEEKKKDSSEFARMLEDSFKKDTGKRLSVGDKVRGEILVLGKEEVFVTTGTRKDGIVPRRDLLDADGNVPHQVGDKIDLFVTQLKGQEVYLSPKMTSKNLADDLSDAFHMRLPVEGKVAEIVNGGFRVLIKGKLAFCPISQMDTKHIEQGDEYLGQRFEFKITKFEESGRNIVVSRRRVLEEEQKLGSANFATEHKVGDVVRGKIARLEKFGAFVELAPGIDGLAHISELSWSRVNDPAEVVQVGQDVAVKILKMESEAGRMRVSLSIKQAGAEPWDNLSGDIKTGQVIQGKVTRCMKFGAFVELAPGIEGLIPLSEMSYTKRVLRSDEIISEGERVLVMIKDIDPEGHRISLSLKDAGQDPWALVAQKFPVGTILAGRVERREAYGLFIKLDDGITGLLPKSKANEKPEFQFDKLKVGDTVTVQVAELRLDERRISLQPPGEVGSEDWKGFVATQAAAATAASFGTLADKLKAAMSGKSEGKKAGKR